MHYGAIWSGEESWPTAPLRKRAITELRSPAPQAQIERTHTGATGRLGGCGMEGVL
jgi:hypothetical protein